MKKNTNVKTKVKTPHIVTRAVSWDAEGNELKYQSTGRMDILGHDYAISGFPAETREKALRSLMSECSNFKNLATTISSMAAFAIDDEV